MASLPPNHNAHRVLEPLSAPQHFVPPSARELRAQAVQRLQTGLFGIAGVVLIVGLANIINDRARMTEAANSSAVVAAPHDGTKTADPLADAGVVPSASTSAVAGPAPAVGGPQH